MKMKLHQHMLNGFLKLLKLSFVTFVFLNLSLYYFSFDKEVIINDLDVTMTWIVKCSRSEFRFDSYLLRAYMLVSKLSWITDKCEHPISNLISVTDNNEIHTVILNSAYIVKKRNIGSLTCFIQEFQKMIHSDKYVEFIGPKFYFKFNNNQSLLSVRLNYSGFYYVECRLNLIDVIYKEVLSILPLKTEKIAEKYLPHRNLAKKSKEKFAQSDKIQNKLLNDIKYEKCDFHDKKRNQRNNSDLGSKMNVLLIGIDSMSFPHFKRVLPKTYKYLQKDFKNNLIFNNYNVVGQNTYANILPLLSGVIQEAIPDLGLNSEVKFFQKFNSTFHDMFPLIWKEYEQIGYLTMYNEDFPFLSTFNMLKDGFKYCKKEYTVNMYILIIILTLIQFSLFE